MLRKDFAEVFKVKIFKFCMNLKNMQISSYVRTAS